MMEKMDPQFAPLLANHNLAALRDHAGVIYGLWADFRIGYLNPAWFRFALENGGEPALSARWDVGMPLFDAMPPDIAGFYRDRYRFCLEQGRTWTHEYDCSTGAVYRRHQKIVLPLGTAGLLVIHSRLVERPRAEPGLPVEPEIELIYRDRNGFVHQCAFCRRVNYPGQAELWDWIPAWAQRAPASTSHTFCRVCYAHYFPGAGHAAPGADPGHGEALPGLKAGPTA